MQGLYKIIDEQSIRLDYSNIRRYGDILGLFVIHPRVGPFILLDRSLLTRPRLERCVLAEEVGHAMYPPRPGHVRFHRHRFKVADRHAVTVEQDENRALRWATDYLMPDDEFLRAGRQGADTVFALAEHFHVTEWFVRKKVGFIRRRGRGRGVKLGWSDIIRRTNKPPPGGFALVSDMAIR